MKQMDNEKITSKRKETFHSLNFMVLKVLFGEEGHSRNRATKTRTGSLDQLPE